jgi:hypothetical protein
MHGRDAEVGGQEPARDARVEARVLEAPAREALRGAEGEHLVFAHRLSYGQRFGEPSREGFELGVLRRQGVEVAKARPQRLRGLERLDPRDRRRG